MSYIDIEKAKSFVMTYARPVEKALYEYCSGNGSRENVIAELVKYQNADGGFGHGLEADNWNPASTPITTNDAVITLWRIGALERDSDVVRVIVRYLSSHDSFIEDKRRWQFAVKGNLPHPHAIWWEPEGDGVTGFNPTVSLAALMVCFGDDDDYYTCIVRNGLEYLRTAEKLSGDDLKCFALCYELLRENNVTDTVDLDELRELITAQLDRSICDDVTKYGVEYVFGPSDFFLFRDLWSDKIKALAEFEKGLFGDLQQEDGSFDITWQWYTPYPVEFEQSRLWWRGRITADRLAYCLE